jgi:hypothetical protein
MHDVTITLSHTTVLIFFISLWCIALLISTRFCLWLFEVREYQNPLLFAIIAAVMHVCLSVFFFFLIK